MTGGPLLLAFDTSTARGVVGVGRGGEVLAREELGPRETHSRTLLPAVDRVLAGAGVHPGELEGVVVGRGPGSFTGVRVAAATAKGLVRVLGVPLYGVSSLAAAAVEAVEGGTAACVLFDARGDRVYGAAFRGAGGRLAAVLPPAATTVTELLERLPDPASFRFLGDGARRHRERIEAVGARVAEAPAGYPTVRGLLTLADAPPEGGRVEDPGRWEPEYLRESRVRTAAGA